MSSQEPFFGSSAASSSSSAAFASSSAAFGSSVQIPPAFHHIPLHTLTRWFHDKGFNELNDLLRFALERLVYEEDKTIRKKIHDDLKIFVDIATLINQNKQHWPQMSKTLYVKSLSELQKTFEKTLEWWDDYRKSKQHTQSKLFPSLNSPMEIPPEIYQIPEDQLGRWITISGKKEFNALLEFALERLVYEEDGDLHKIIHDSVKVFVAIAVFIDQNKNSWKEVISKLNAKPKSKDNPANQAAFAKTLSWLQSYQEGYQDIPPKLFFIQPQQPTVSSEQTFGGGTISDEEEKALQMAIQASLAATASKPKALHISAPQVEKKENLEKAKRLKELKTDLKLKAERLQWLIGQIKENEQTLSRGQAELIELESDIELKTAILFSLPPDHEERGKTEAELKNLQDGYNTKQEFIMGFQQNIENDKDTTAREKSTCDSLREKINKLEMEIKTETEASKPDTVQAPGVGATLTPLFALQQAKGTEAASSAIDLAPKTGGSLDGAGHR